MFIKTTLICCAIGGSISTAGITDYIKNFSTMSSDRHTQIEQQVNSAVTGTSNRQLTIAQQINFPGAQ